MKQGRKTTFEERVEIVNFIITHGQDYQTAIENMVSLTNKYTPGAESLKKIASYKTLIHLKRRRFKF